MSGGSFNYLCWKDVKDLFDLSSETFEFLESMEEDLREYAEDAAEETGELIALIKRSVAQATAMRDRLSDLWKAVEWAYSGDWSPDHVQDAVERYREKKTEQEACVEERCVGPGTCTADEALRVREEEKA